jgi:hypothetical protein
MFRPVSAVFMAFLVIAAGCAGAPVRSNVRDIPELLKNEGMPVTLRGEITGIMWQHMVAPSGDYREVTYVDFGKSQIVAYSKKPISCRGPVELTGTVIKLTGESRDPRRKESVDEYHVLVDSWTCLKEGP